MDNIELELNYEDVASCLDDDSKRALVYDLVKKHEEENGLTISDNEYVVISNDFSSLSFNIMIRPGVKPDPDLIDMLHKSSITIQPLSYYKPEQPR